MILGISGVAGSGKSTIADYIGEKYNFAVVSLADPVKRLAKQIYAFSDEVLWGPSSLRNAPDKRYLRSTYERHDWQESGPQWVCTRCQLKGDEAPPECKVYLSPRFCLQSLGTGFGRECYENTWVDLGISTAKSLLAKDARKGRTTLKYSPQEGIYRTTGRQYFGVVIPDVRFKNEVRAVRDANGRLLRVTRAGAGLSGAGAVHASEQEQLSIPDSAFDWVVENNSDIEVLHSRLDAIMAECL